MRVVGLAGRSGAGKTTLAEAVIAHLRQRGLRVSVVKHAHHEFEIDTPGKDTWRHRQAGAFEVVIASDQRLALLREFERTASLSVHHLIAELYEGVDWVIVEGFKDSDLPKIEVIRPSTGQPAQYDEDPFVLAVATDDAAALPWPTDRPVLNINDPEGLTAWLIDNQDRFDYLPERYLP